MSVLLELWPILSDAAAKHHRVSPDANDVIGLLAADGNVPVHEVHGWKRRGSLPESKVLERYAGLYLYSRQAIQPLIDAAKDYVPRTTLPKDPSYYGAVGYALKDGDPCVQAAGLFCEHYGIESGMTCLEFIEYLVTRNPRSIEEGLGMLILAYPQHSIGAVGQKMSLWEANANVETDMAL